MEDYIPTIVRRQIYGYTKGGRKFYPLLPEATQISLEDIAYSLSNTNRFGAHTDPLFNVAAHSLLVANMVEDYFQRAEWIDDLTVQRLALSALLHDAHEAYVGDLPIPLKRSLPEFTALEEKWMERLSEEFGLLSMEDWPILKEADRAALVVESNMTFVPEAGIHYADYPSYNTIQVQALADRHHGTGEWLYRLPPTGAERRFLARAEVLIATIERIVEEGGNVAV
jgi:hypothetical protein